MRSSSPIAPMDGLFTAITAVVAALPVLFLVIAWLTPEIRWVMLGSAAFIYLLSVAVWVFTRPTSFDVDDDGLHIVFPAWTRTIPRSELRGAEVFEGTRYTDTHGHGLRVGVGGLFGTFGWLRFSHATLETYITRRSDLVVVARAGASDLLLTPESPEAFAKAVEDALYT